MTFTGRITQIDLDEMISKMSYQGKQYPGRVKFDFVNSPHMRDKLIELIGTEEQCTIVLDSYSHILELRTKDFVADMNAVIETSSGS